MPLTASLTMLEPSRAFCLVWVEASAACCALRATSSTVAFISSMAVAVSRTRLDCSSAPRLDCSIWAESCSEAVLTIPTTLSSWRAACNMPSALARSACLRAASASRVACWAFFDSSAASRPFCSASAILVFSVATMFFMAPNTPCSVRAGSKRASRSPPAIARASFESEAGSSPNWRSMLRAMKKPSPRPTSTEAIMPIMVMRREVSYIRVLSWFSSSARRSLRSTTA